MIVMVSVEFLSEEDDLAGVIEKDLLHFTKHRGKSSSPIAMQGDNYIPIEYLNVFMVTQLTLFDYVGVVYSIM